VGIAVEKVGKIDILLREHKLDIFMVTICAIFVNCFIMRLFSANNIFLLKSALYIK